MTTAEYLEAGEYYLVTGTDFVNGRIDWGRCYFVDKERYDQDRNIQLALGDVLITKDGPDNLTEMCPKDPAVLEEIIGS